MKSDAYFSEDRLYRYWLFREWDESKPRFACIGVNPSDADEQKNDPTIRKEIGFGTRLGYGGLLAINIGAFVATDPREWRKAIDPIGSENHVENLKYFIKKFRCERVIAAWGRNGRYAEKQCAIIVDQLANLWCFGVNNDGTPRHPLMLPYSTELIPLSVAQRRDDGEVR